MHSDLSLGGGHGDVSGAKFLGLGLQGKGGTGSHFTNAETEAQRGDKTCSRSQGQALADSKSYWLPQHGGLEKSWGLEEHLDSLLL